MGLTSVSPGNTGCSSDCLVPAERTQLRTGCGWACQSPQRDTWRMRLSDPQLFVRFHGYEAHQRGRLRKWSSRASCFGITHQVRSSQNLRALGSQPGIVWDKEGGGNLGRSIALSLLCCMGQEARALQSGSPTRSQADRCSLKSFKWLFEEVFKLLKSFLVIPESESGGAGRVMNSDVLG